MDIPVAVFSIIEGYSDFHEFLRFSSSCWSARQSGVAQQFAYDCWASELRFSIEREVLGSDDVVEDWIPDYWHDWSSGNDFLED